MGRVELRKNGGRRPSKHKNVTSTYKFRFAVIRYHEKFGMGATMQHYFQAWRTHRKLRDTRAWACGSRTKTRPQKLVVAALRGIWSDFVRSDSHSTTGRDRSATGAVDQRLSSRWCSGLSTHATIKGRRVCAGGRHCMRYVYRDMGLAKGIPELTGAVLQHENMPRPNTTDSAIKTLKRFDNVMQKEMTKL